VRGYVVRRLIGSLVVLFMTVTLIFVLTRVAPGDPAATILGAAATPEAVAKLNHDMKLDRSLPVQYVDYISKAVRGDFGESYYSHLPALHSVVDRLPVTGELALLTMTVSVLAALGLAIATARVRARWFSRLVDGTTLVGLSIPTFWSGLLLLLLFGLYWPDIVPAGGWTFFSDSPVENLRRCVLPVIALSVPTIAILYRALRASMKDVLNRDYVTFARASGVREGRLIRKVAVPNAVVPTATVAGLLLGYMLGGSLIIETIFSIPGLGQLVVLSLQRRDFPVATAAVSFVAFGFILINFLVDVIYAYLSPRVRELYSRKTTMREA
jgi:ABC-type dipeptide/oligopeptide/nickel transport system permease component